MLLPPFWWGRGKHAPAKNRLARFGSVLEAAQRVEEYRRRLAAANLSDVRHMKRPEEAIHRIEPISREQYRNLFPFRRPAWRQVPQGPETRSGFLLPYAVARAGLENCRIVPAGAADLYSPLGMLQATADLVRLSRAVNSGGVSSADVDHALVIFCGMEAGILSEKQRDELWRLHQTPLFECLVGTDGEVVAAECEAHGGLHVRGDAAVVESLDGEIAITSLTDLEAPALRLMTGIKGALEMDACDCGSAAPRIVEVTGETALRSNVASAG